MQPTLTVFTGPMFGSKTTKMLSVLERCSYQNKSVIAFKPKMDDRYASSHIVTHAGLKFKAFNVQNGTEILEMSKDYDVVGVDEAFMIEDSAKALLSLYRAGKTVVVSSIQISASGQVFEEISSLLPWATKIEVCPAVCVKTGCDAYYTVRKAPASNEIEVGGSEMYEPRAWSHTPFVNRKFGETYAGTIKH
jgi:thymidine kinase